MIQELKVSVGVSGVTDTLSNQNGIAGFESKPFPNKYWIICIWHHCVNTFFYIFIESNGNFYFSKGG